MKERSGCLSRQKNFIIICLMAWLSCPVLGQDAKMSVGAQSWGTGNATIANGGISSAFTNIAGLAGIKDASALSSYDSYYGFEGINTMAFGFVFPFSDDFGSAITVHRFGGQLYNELSIGMGAAHRIDRFSLGVKVNYLQKAVNTSNVAWSRRAFVVEFGGVVRVSDHFFLGAHLYNLTQASFRGGTESKVPTLLRVGFSYLPLKTVQLSVEGEKDTDMPVNFKMGLSYQAFKKIWFRTGIATQPMTHHFGTGFREKRFSVDYAAHFHKQLGLSHHLSLAYHMLAKKKSTEASQ